MAKQTIKKAIEDILVSTESNPKPTYEGIKPGGGFWNKKRVILGGALCLGLAGILYAFNGKDDRNIISNDNPPEGELIINPPRDRENNSEEGNTKPKYDYQEIERYLKDLENRSRTMEGKLGSNNGFNLSEYDGLEKLLSEYEVAEEKYKDLPPGSFSRIIEPYNRLKGLLKECIINIPDNRAIVCVGGDTLYKISNKEIKRLYKGDLHSWDITSDGKVLVISAKQKVDKEYNLYKVIDGKISSLLDLDEFGRFIKVMKPVDDIYKISPEISPDGNYVAFKYNDYDGMTLCLVNINGKNHRRICKESKESDSFLLTRFDFSPDGRYIAHLMNNDTSIAIINLETGEREEKKHNVWGPTQVSWGERGLVFNSRGGHPAGIFYLENNQKLEGVNGSFASWSPEGDAIIYLQEYNPRGICSFNLINRANIKLSSFVNDPSKNDPLSKKILLTEDN